jgi:hypothetical protein
VFIYLPSYAKYTSLA